MGKAFLVIRMKGTINVPHWANTTLDLLHLDKRFRATIVPERDNTKGMLNKIQHYVSWQEIDVSTTKELLEKRARKEGYRKLTSEDIEKLGFKNTDELAKSLADGAVALSKLKPLKPWFALAPPRHGFKRSTKKMYGQGGILGNHKELLTQVKMMI
ncbi:LSU ribosomal protein L7e (L30p) [Candidatus Nitrosotalea sp. TS]|uniref:50S ribosomal protein L30 n=1 Tax=Candidatus Nitrosotalea sp. TS TaxID=2341020 RepID=UPI00140A4060|nr:50S ribosomal protein L30 [Candidatus Nitrosotalea sp. TS]NHI04433.1 LSU ribosomal protein L7e (L30p) [Candidatus Nitrosotalea sp. TS]